MSNARKAANPLAHQFLPAMLRNLIAGLVTGLAISTSVHAQSDSAVRDLIARYAQPYRSNIRIENTAATEGRDTYEIESKDGQIVLRGNTGVAQASAFYHYLKEFCHAHVSWNGDNLTLPAHAPLVPEKIHVVSPVVHRMAYNYCTHGYTMPFWNEAQWDREIDWLALHGINEILVIEGQEAVWQKTFTRFGYTSEEVRQWLCSPAHVPWQFMQNMQGMLPPPQSVIDARAELGRHIVARCKQFGIEPILQGYYGMLPSGFAAKHPEARIFPQGGWAGGNHRPDMLDPGDPLFSTVARAFMEEQRKIYGDVKYLAADPFHEGGSSKGMNRGTVYKQVQDAILAFDPSITLVKQCWQTSNKEMFDAGQKDKSLALDLNCDFRPFWKKANGYDGTAWAWGFIYNFGGNLALEGNPTRLAADFGAALSDPAHGNLSGTAIVPEGSNTNPLVYELMTEMAWRGAPADVHAWVQDYLQARYGSKDSNAEAAWEIILKTAYAMPPTEGPVNSILTARPSLDAKTRGRTWSPGSKVSYSNRDLLKAWETLLKAAPQLGSKDTFRYDLADVSRQVLTNYSRPLFDQLRSATAEHDVATFRQHKDGLLHLFADLDELTGTRREWLMGAWVSDARRWGHNTQEAAYMDKIARMILTTWVENPQTDLSDYANREWNGLLGQYYLPRWKMFLDQEESALSAGKPLDMGAFNKARGEFEVNWIRSGASTLAAKPVGDTVAVSRRLFNKYSGIGAESRVALAKPEWNRATFHDGNPILIELPLPQGSNKKSGTLTVEFVYRSGANALRIQNARIEAGGRVISEDKHEGWTGTENRANRFTFTVPESVTGTMTLVASIEGAAGTDSAGEIRVSY